MLLIIGALSFGAAAIVGILLAELLPVMRLQGGPPAQEPPILGMIAGCMAVGAFATAHDAALSELILLAVVVGCLCAVWCTDARSGIIPDVCTLGPLAMLLLVAVSQRDWHPLVSAATAFAPFALAAMFSGGTGMGWGDVKLAALGGAVLGMPAILVFALACAVASGTAIARGQRRIPIALGPYLAGAILAGMPLVVLR